MTKKLDWSMVILKWLTIANCVGLAILFTIHFIGHVSGGEFMWAIYCAFAVIFAIWGTFAFSRMPTS